MSTIRERLHPICSSSAFEASCLRIDTVAAFPASFLKLDLLNSFNEGWGASPAEVAVRAHTPMS